VTEVPGTADVQRPALTVVAGRPSTEELAAVVVVLGVATRATVPGRASPASLWAARSRAMRTPLRAGSGAWRASGLPG
jgi:hypothetical protein